MSETPESLRRKINSASDLHSVVRTMKSLAIANIGQYEQSVQALGDYYHAVELGLSVCFRKDPLALPTMMAATNAAKSGAGILNAVVFGSDQGLVGQFNDDIADFALEKLLANAYPENGSIQLWAVGERVHGRLAEAVHPHAKMKLMPLINVPNSVKAITPLVSRILLLTESPNPQQDIAELQLFHHRPASGNRYAPVCQRLLPLDERWRLKLAQLPWPSKNLPQTLGDGNATLRALIGEYLFVSLFRSAAESLASENASRLSAMQRADKNIQELRDELNAEFHRLRQSGIDEELFDLVAGFSALSDYSR